MWNPVDSVEVLSMRPEPTTGVGGRGGGAAAGTHTCALEMWRGEPEVISDLERVVLALDTEVVLV